jgi:hypothetical protein
VLEARRCDGDGGAEGRLVYLIQGTVGDLGVDEKRLVSWVQAVERSTVTAAFRLCISTASAAPKPSTSDGWDRLGADTPDHEPSPGAPLAHRCSDGRAIAECCLQKNEPGSGLRP